MKSNESWVGKTVMLRPTQGNYQKDLAGSVVSETPTQFAVQAPGFLSPKKFRKADGMPVAKIDQQFPCYKAEVQMNAAAARAEPQNCPKCGAAPAVKNPRAKRWYVVCSNNTGVLGGHNIVGHAMFTRHDAIAEWNKLT